MKNFSISAPWRSRPETPDQLAHRLKSLLARLRPVTPHFRRWFYSLAADKIPELTDAENWLISGIAADVCTDDLGAPAPALGFLPLLLNTPQVDVDRNDHLWLHMTAGSTFINDVAIRQPQGLAWHPDLVTFPVVKQTMLEISESFEPLWSDAGPLCLWKDMPRQHYKQGPVMMPCWMIHLPQPLARRVTPLPGLVSERYDDGSLFLAATDETFDPDNAEHIAAADRLFALIDPLQEKLPREQWRC